MTSYHKPSLTVVLTSVEGSQKQLQVNQWLNYDMSSSFLHWKAFTFYNKDYPRKIDRNVFFGEPLP